MLYYLDRATFNFWRPLVCLTDVRILRINGFCSIPKMNVLLHAFLIVPTQNSCQLPVDKDQMRLWYMDSSFLDDKQALDRNMKNVYLPVISENRTVCMLNFLREFLQHQKIPRLTNSLYLTVQSYKRQQWTHKGSWAHFPGFCFPDNCHQWSSKATHWMTQVLWISNITFHTKPEGSVMLEILHWEDIAVF